MGYVDDNSEVFVNDFHAKEEGAPSLDVSEGGTNNILAFSGSQTNGVTNIKFRRYLASSDLKDKTIASGLNDVMSFLANFDILR